MIAVEKNIPISYVGFFHNRLASDCNIYNFRFGMERTYFKYTRHVSVCVGFGIFHMSFQCDQRVGFERHFWPEIG